MKLIFTARNDMEVHFVQGLLQQEAIENIIQGEALEGAWGDLPLSASALPGIWVNDADVERANPIIEEYRRREQHKQNDEQRADAPSGPTWKCPKCAEEVEEQFDTCWNCGTERPA